MMNFAETGFPFEAVEENYRFCKVCMLNSALGDLTLNLTFDLSLSLNLTSALEGSTLTLTFGSGPENGHETALELVSGANFGCVLHHFSSPARLDWSRGQVLPELVQNPKIQIIILIKFSTNSAFQQSPGPAAALTQRAWTKQRVQL